MMRECCDSLPGTDHYVECPRYERPLTVEEIRYLRTATGLASVTSDTNVRGE